MTDFAQGVPTDTSPLSRSIQQPHPLRLDDGSDASRIGSTLHDGAPEAHRPTSAMSQSNTLTPSRGGTLKKKQSLIRKSSLKRSTSMKSIGAGDSRTLRVADREKRADAEDDEMNSAFSVPVPTHGNPTEILANRFQAWRKVLKDLITYFRDIQKSYESRSKSLLTISNVINTTTQSSMFLAEGGISDATQILRDYNKQSLAEGNKARNIEEDVIAQLTGLRSDLQQKIKEIKNLSGDFKNAVDKETESTRKAVQNLQEVLEAVDTASSGKSDPYLVKLSVDRQVEKQLEEENYLHRAFLNLESSGRELESIVVGEIQKAYNVYAGILKREADEAYDAADRLRSGPIAMAKDHEWESFIDKNENFVDPKVPVRSVEHIYYPGKEHPAASEVRAGMLERKSKYLKSYTPGWYVLSPTHLHEFKSPDRLTTQTPIMSLYLPDQKLGSRSGTDSSSHKFMLKGRQTGSMHRGHAWVFRAESRDTMLAWYDDIKNLTEKTGEERNAFIRQHARSVSGGSQKPASVSSDGAMDEDEADQVPYSATASQSSQPLPQQDQLLKRPQPGGRFPSDLNVNRNLLVPLSPSSGASSDDSDIVTTAGALPRSDVRNGHTDQMVRSKENPTVSEAIPGDVLRNASTRESYTPTAQTSEHIDLQELPAMHDSAQQTPARQAATQPDTTHEETAPSASPIGISNSSSHYDSYIPIAQKVEYNNLSVHEGAYSPSQQALVTRAPASDIAPGVSRDISQHGPIAPQTQYFGFPVIQGAPDPEQQTAVSRAFSQQNATEKASNQNPPGVEFNNQPVQAHGISSEDPGTVPYGSPQRQQPSAPAPKSLPYEPIRHDSTYGTWLGPKGTGVAGPEAAVGASKSFQRPQQHDLIVHEEQQPQVVQQLQSEPVELDSTISAPSKLSGVNGTFPTPPADGAGNHAGDRYLAPGAQSSSDANMAPPTLVPSAGEPLADDFHVPGEFPPTPTAI